MISLRPPSDPDYFEQHPQLLAFTEADQQFGVVQQVEGKWVLSGLSPSHVIGMSNTLWGLFPIMEEYLTKPGLWIHETGSFDGVQAALRNARWRAGFSNG